MAYATEVTISTGNKVTFNYQSREVGVSLTYCLESSDTDVLQVVKEKATEVAQAHGAVWQKMRDEKVAQKRNTRSNGKAAAGAPRPSPIVSLTLVEQEEENDSDTEVKAEPEEETEVFQPASEAQRKALYALFSASTMTDGEITAILHQSFDRWTVNELSEQQASRLLVDLQRNERERLARDRSDNRQAKAAGDS